MVGFYYPLGLAITLLTAFQWSHGTRLKEGETKPNMKEYLLRVFPHSVHFHLIVFVNVLLLVYIHSCH